MIKISIKIWEVETQMAFAEKELDQIIINHLSKELASNIEVPDIDGQWQKIKKQIIEEDDISKIQKRVLDQKGILYKSSKNEKNEDVFEEIEI